MVPNYDAGRRGVSYTSANTICSLRVLSILSSQGHLSQDRPETPVNATSVLSHGSCQPFSPPESAVLPATEREKLVKTGIS
jgi:hypothetical protein